jgi:hypothetical protein
MVFLIGSALPRLVHSSRVLSVQATYTARSPGQGCDIGGATWTVQPDAPISLRCLSTGTQITALPGKTGFVGFDLPGGNTLAQKYHVSVRIDFSNASHIYVDILTRFSDPGYYVNAICADGNWDLGRRLDKFTDLAYGQIAPTHTYMLVATTDGPKQSLAIKGIEKASVSDGTLTAGQILVCRIGNMPCIWERAPANQYC